MKPAAKRPKTAASPPPKPVRLRCEYFENPLGLDTLRPRLSWELPDTGRRGAAQSARHVLAASTKAALESETGDLWDTGWVKSDTTTQIPYAGAEPASGQRVWWTVRYRDENGKTSPWAPAAWWETGLLRPTDWKAQWIGADLVGSPTAPVPAPLLRREFDLDRPVEAARLHVTALGLFEVWINGTRVGNDLLAPGWTDYRKRIPVHTCDVTHLLVRGRNCAGAMLGDGWATGHIGPCDRQGYADRPRLLFQLELRFPGGGTGRVISDSHWKTAPGPIVASDMLMGEHYDARLEIPGWNEPGLDDIAWRNARAFPDPGAARVPRRGPAVRKVLELPPAGPPRKIGGWGRHKRVFDLGQNMVGWVRLTVRAKAGAAFYLRHAEILDANGDLYTANLRGARATDAYTCRGDGEETWEPRFTFHGFRYVEVSGPPEFIDSAAVTGIVVMSETPPTGEFDCSDPLINQLQRNIQWGQRGNFLEIPTDCPQRDERLGWTGDAQVFARTAAFNMDVAAFFNKWAADVADAQTAEGTIPPICPVPPGMGGGDGGPAWADAAVICPWTIHLCYGDTRIIEENLGVMRRFLDAIGKKAKDLIRAHPDTDPWGGFGDWLATDVPPTETVGATPKDLIGTAYYAYCAHLAARMAAAIGRDTEAAGFERLAERVRRAFQKRFLTPDGLVAGGTQTAAVLALHFNLAPEEIREKIAAALVRDIERRGNKLTTGFVGSSYLPWALSEHGHAGAAFKLLHQKDWPSWLYAVTQGATTIWERWDGWTKERGFQDPSMNSFNHYAYGAIGHWLYAYVAGLDVDPGGPGYKRLRIRPHPGGELKHARARLHTMHGPAECGWKLSGAALEIAAVIPPNTSASAELPAPKDARITEGGKPLEQAAGVSKVKRGDGIATLELAPGHYKFRVA